MTVAQRNSRAISVVQAWDSAPVQGLVIPATVLLQSGTTYTSVSTVISNANSAASAVATKLSKDTADILSGVVSIQTTGAFQVVGGTPIQYNASHIPTAGTGVCITSAGLFGIKNGTVGFTITGSGDATFSGTLAAATGTISSVYATNLNVASGTLGSVLATNLTVQGGNCSLTATDVQNSGTYPVIDYARMRIVAADEINTYATYSTNFFTLARGIDSSSSIRRLYGIRFASNTSTLGLANASCAIYTEADGWSGGSANNNLYISAGYADSAIDLFSASRSGSLGLIANGIIQATAAQGIYLTYSAAEISLASSTINIANGTTSLYLANSGSAILSSPGSALSLVGSTIYANSKIVGSNASGQIPISNGTVCSNLYADFSAGTYYLSTSIGWISTYSGTFNASYSTDGGATWAAIKFRFY